MNNFFTVNPGFVTITNATTYYIIFDNDIGMDTGVLNYTILVEENIFSNIFSIGLTLSQSPTIEAIFGYDNDGRTKDYGVNDISNLPTANNWIVIKEQIYVRTPLPDRLFVNNEANLMFNLNTLIFGSDNNGMASSHDYDALVFLTVTRLPGMLRDSCIHIINK